MRRGRDDANFPDCFSEPLLTDGDIIMTTLSDSDLFPGLDSSIEAHKGFVDAHAKLVSVRLLSSESMPYEFF